MAGSLRWHLDRHPGERVVLIAHNAHIQAEPVSFDGHLTGYPMGHYLRAALGDDYFALGLTAEDGRTGEMRLDPDARFGFTVEDVRLDAPEAGSVEAAFTGTGPALVDLRRARAEATDGPGRIRMQSGYLSTPVLTAFDGLISTGVSTVVEGF